MRRLWTLFWTRRWIRTFLTIYMGCSFSPFGDWKMQWFTYWWWFCTGCNVIWSSTTRSVWFYVYAWFYRYSQLDELNSRVVQTFKSCSFILLFNSCFNISEVNLHILLIITPNKSLLSLILSISAFLIMSSVTVLIALINLVIYLCLLFWQLTKYSLL